MALSRGTNYGFCAVSPSADPSGAATQEIDNTATAARDTSPATAIKVTEIGWWCDNATEESNFEVAIYEDDSANTEPGAIVAGKSVTNDKGTAAGWKKVTGLNITISSNTVYWIAVQLDNVTTATNIDREYSGNYAARLTPIAALPDPDWGASTSKSDDPVAIYAIWEAASGLSIPVATTITIF